MKWFLSTISIVAIVYFLFSIFTPDVWTGVYYPNGCLGCTDKYIYSPKFDTAGKCLAWARSIQVQRNNADDDFECGKNCKPMEDTPTVNLCEESV